MFEAFGCNQVWILRGCLWLIASLGLIASTVFDTVAVGGTITYITPTSPSNSVSTWSGLNGTFNQNMGIAFKTGSSGPFNIDWIEIGLNTSGVTSGSASLTMALRNTSNSTPYSAVAGATEYAKDTVTFSMPTTTGTYFDLSLSSASLPNISSYAMQSNTAYALILYAPTVNIALGRKTGYANGTTNNFYTVTNGFTMLDTFRSNSANYSNNSSSYPTLDISFGATTTPPPAVPEPTSMAIFGLGALGMAYRNRRKSKDKV